MTSFGQLIYSCASHRAKAENYCIDVILHEGFVRLLTNELLAIFRKGTGKMKCLAASEGMESEIVEP